MKYTFWLMSERAQFIIKQMEGHIEVLEIEGGFTKLEFTIETANDLHNLFHAGTQAGIDQAFQTINNQSTYEKNNHSNSTYRNYPSLFEFL